MRPALVNVLLVSATGSRTSSTGNMSYHVVTVVTLLSFIVLAGAISVKEANNWLKARCPKVKECKIDGYQWPNPIMPCTKWEEYNSCYRSESIECGLGETKELDIAMEKKRQHCWDQCSYELTQKECEGYGKTTTTATITTTEPTTTTTTTTTTTEPTTTTTTTTTTEPTTTTTTTTTMAPTTTPTTPEPTTTTSQTTSSSKTLTTARPPVTKAEDVLSTSTGDDENADHTVGNGSPDDSSTDKNSGQDNTSVNIADIGSVNSGNIGNTETKEDSDGGFNLMDFLENSSSSTHGLLEIVLLFPFLLQVLQHLL